jgi:phosphoenolpyruvate carboxykinase (ATP)
MVNTGWSGGGSGVGQRIKLAYTRAMVDAIHAGALASAATERDPIFGLAVPRSCPGVPAEILHARNTWPSPGAYDAAAKKLVGLFRANFEKHAAAVRPEVGAAGPVA